MKHLSFALLALCGLTYSQPVRSVWSRANFALTGINQAVSTASGIAVLDSGNFMVFGEDSGVALGIFSRSGTQSLSWRESQNFGFRAFAKRPNGNFVGVGIGGYAKVFNQQGAIVESFSWSGDTLTQSALVKDKMLHVVGGDGLSSHCFYLRFDMETETTVVLDRSFAGNGFRKVVVDSQDRSYSIGSLETGDALVQHLANGAVGFSIVLASSRKIVDVAVEANGNILILGERTDQSFREWPFVRKYSPQGTLLDEYEFAYEFNARKLLLDNAGKVIVGMDGGVGLAYSIVGKLDPANLNLIWLEDSGFSTERHVVTDMLIDAHNEVYVGGHVLRGSNLLLAVQKFSASGNRRWSATGAIIPSTYQYAGGRMAIHPASGDVMIASNVDVFGNSSFGLTAGIFRQAPTGVNDGFNVRRNTTYTAPRAVTTNDRNWQGSVISLDTPPSNGSVSLASNGTFTYTPRSGFTGVDTFKYKLSKANLDTNVATVQLNVSP